MAAVAIALSLPGMAAPGLEQLERWLPTIPNEISVSRATQMLELANAELELDPTNGTAVASRARSMIALGQYLEAAAVLERQVELNHQPMNALYNMACSLAMGGDKEAALKALERALAHGIPVQFPRHDKDLRNLWPMPEFQALVAP